LLPGYHFASRGELIVASRLPITHVSETPLPPGPESRPALAVTVLSERGHITIICVHLLPMQLDGKLSEPTPKLAADCRAFGAARIVQSQELLAFTKTVPLSFILICGDFNAPPQTHSCRMLTDVYPDAFDAAGNGFGYTVTSDWPFTRIDHILTGTGVKVFRTRVPDTRASDHRPLVAKIALAS
jgi:endonuclease/exonuclease/phosphatase family metal-dependent hydrolase